MTHLSLAIPVVGGGAPGWIGELPVGLAKAELVTGPSVEEGLNRILSLTTAPYFFPVQAEDQLRPEGVLALLDGLREAHGGSVAAVAPAEQVGRDGGLRPTPATPAASTQALLALRRISTPVLFRTAALRQAGGWRPGEASWDRRPFRHRGLLARLLAGGGALIAVAEPLGVVALPQGAPEAASGHDLPAVLHRLLYQPIQVRLAGGGPPIQGRVVAVTPALLTLAGPEGQIILLSVERIVAVASVSETPKAEPHQPSPIPRGARVVTRVSPAQRPSWP